MLRLWIANLIFFLLGMIFIVQFFQLMIMKKKFMVEDISLERCTASAAVPEF